jgi:hypothetical protein
MEMKRLKTIQAAAVAAALSLVMLRGSSALAPAPPQDVITVGSLSTLPGTIVDVPVYIRDVSGTPLGIDQPTGSRIQSYSIKVNYAPASAVQSITFTRAGITASKTPLFESSPSSAGTISLIDTFSESTNLLPFTSNKPAPGDQVAHLLITIPAGTPAGALTLTLDPTLTQLSNEAGTISETVANTRLLLVSGTVTILPTVPALGTIALVLVGLALAFVAFVALRMRA